MQFTRWGRKAVIALGSVRVCTLAFAVEAGRRTRRVRKGQEEFTKEGTLKLGINRQRASTS